jgi:hypothetical protein
MQADIAVSECREMIWITSINGMISSTRLCPPVFFSVFLSADHSSDWSAAKKDLSTVIRADKAANVHGVARILLCAGRTGRTVELCSVPTPPFPATKLLLEIEHQPAGASLSPIPRQGT